MLVSKLTPSEKDRICIVSNAVTCNLVSNASHVLLGVIIIPSLFLFICNYSQINYSDYSQIILEYFQSSI